MHILGLALTGFQTAEAAEFALDRSAYHMRQPRDFGGDRDIIVIVCWSFGVFLE